MKELGYDIEFYLWVGLFAPKGTPAPVVAKLREESKKAVASDHVQAGHRRTSDDEVTYHGPARLRQVPREPTPSASRARSARSASCNHDRRPGLVPGAAHVILRRDHIAGGAFVAAGVLVLAVSHDLPFGTLASPGAGMLPMLVIALMILFGLILVAAGRREPADRRNFLARPAARGEGHGGRRRRRLALHDAGFRHHHGAAAVRAGVRRRAARTCSPPSPSASRFRSSPTWLFEHALKTPLERGLLWF